MLHDVDIGERQEKPLAPVLPPCPFCAAEWERYSAGKGAYERAIHRGVLTDGSCVLAGQIFAEPAFPLLMMRDGKTTIDQIDGGEDGSDDQDCG
jgi:hypothetical protein